MTFLNGILLAGAAAFMIPLLIHLFNRRRVTVVKWGAMHLLEAVIKQKKRNIKVEQWLLLATRIILPIVLALCLARPVLSALSSLAGFGKTSLVIVLDDSFSMRAPASGGSPMEQARQAIQRMTEELPHGSDVQVILAGGTPRSLLEQPTTVLDLVPKSLADASSLFGPFSANDAFQAAASALNKAANGAREVVLMSDFQQSDWKAYAGGASVPALESLLKQDPKPMLTFFRLNNDVTENLSIASLELSALVAAEGQPVGARVRVKNNGKRLWQDVALHLEADGTRLRTTRITVPAEGEVTLSFTHAFDTVGDHSLGVRVEGDSLTDDNAAQAIVHVRHQINVLLVDGHPGNEPLSGAVDFLELALSPNMAAATGSKDLLLTSKVDEKRLRKEDFSHKEVVILADVDRLQGGHLNDLEKFVKEGGGLLVFAGPTCDIAAYNRDLFRNGEGLYPAKIRGYGSISPGENPARILMQRFTHPAVTYFNDARSGRLQDAEFRNWFQFEAAGSEVKTVLSLDRGLPLFLEKPYGRGRVMASATTANSEWTNLPMQVVFVPLLQRMVSHLATQNGASSAQYVGQPVRFGLRDGKGDESFEMTDPAGRTTEVKAHKETNGVVVESPPTKEPGLYTVKTKGTTELQRFAFNVNPAESDLKPLAAADVQKVAQRYQAPVVENFDAYQKVDRTRRHGTELWQPFLLALLALLFIEVLLQQRIARP
ncbi:MAG: N-terminal double-transrane protein [Verrucomicrobiaceae bacterium]|nr:N-terminal double-transrane protein [Verrucomicrobiaceae bacterium]